MKFLTQEVVVTTQWKEKEEIISYKIPQDQVIMKSSLPWMRLESMSSLVIETIMLQNLLRALKDLKKQLQIFQDLVNMITRQFKWTQSVDILYQNYIILKLDLLVMLKENLWTKKFKVFFSFNLSSWPRKLSSSKRLWILRQ